MKILMIVFGVLFIFATSAGAQMDCKMMDGQMGKTGGMDKSNMMPMMMRCQHMMMEHGMQNQDMMQMMMDIMKIQRKLMRGMGEAEKKETIKDLGKMMDRMEKMMTETRGMMKGGMMMHMMHDHTKKEEPKKEEPKKETPKPSPHKH